MLDIVRVFRILHWLSEEQNHFLVAQDSYIICCSLLEQFTNLETVIEEYNDKIEALELQDLKDGPEYSGFTSVVDKLQDMVSRLDFWIPQIIGLRDQAFVFWQPATTDLEKCPSSHSKVSRKWRKNAEENEKGDFSFPADTLEQVEAFRQTCKAIVHTNFSELLQKLIEEETLEEQQAAMLTNNYLRLGSTIPTSFLRDIESSVRLLTVVTDFPLTHFLLPARHFAKLLGFSRARMITIPFMRFIVNTAETNFVVSTSQKGTNRPSTVIFYRCADGELACVHWEIGENIIDGHFIAYGMDITTEVVNTRSDQGENMQRILRQWLHSIRNASFQQQAQLIEEDVLKLQAQLGHDPKLQSEFQGVLSGLSTLIYTTKASVGLIDQALYSKGLMSCTCVGDFVNALVTFAPNFARSEKMNGIDCDVKVYLNQVQAFPDDLRHLFVGSDMLRLQNMIDNIFSNAIRYTDKEKGVDVELKIVESEALVQFMLKIVDFRSGGMPSSIVKYLQENIDFQKVIDKRSRRKARSIDIDCISEITLEEPLSSSSSGSTSSRSSLTGIPHIVEMYHALTSSGEHDMDMIINVTDEGTTFTLSFAFGLLAPPASVFEDPVENEVQSLRDIFKTSTKKFLVVDDSAVVRRMLVRLFEKLEVPCHSCVDGSQAADWFSDHHEECCGVVTDLEMPKMGGEGLICHVKSINPDIPCVVVSGNEAISYSMPNGAMSALMKPISIDGLQDILKAMLNIS